MVGGNGGRPYLDLAPVAEAEEAMTSGPGDSSWTPPAAEVLERACDHYGGVQAWRALRRIRLIPAELSGLLPWLKGMGNTFRLPSAFEIDPHERRTRFLGYPDADHVGLFENGAVRIERRDGGDVVAESRDHRQSFRALAKHRRWAPLDALYFFGYALAHYHALPFTLREARLLRARTAGSRNKPVDILDVELPADLPTHCRRQTFYFDRSGRLTRHDYHAEIVGFLARGAHFWKRETICNGLPICMERHVVARLGATPSPLTALRATFTSAELEFDAPPTSGRADWSARVN
jgi:hypothetical protein